MLQSCLKGFHLNRCEGTSKGTGNSMTDVGHLATATGLVNTKDGTKKNTYIFFDHIWKKRYTPLKCFLLQTIRGTPCPTAQYIMFCNKCFTSK
ncbi:hypothetical protein PR048_012598 [Dryococelus australis]|uniref:Uncharacterized protein n=1 Tax=Dryococelus australis TaxID=614101 RepID=A0ABQ9HQ82_9NEOP|nr:hypothetical protein PR048_012598 [Dryococelus australis]